jgi:hypothetical protein
MKSVRTKRVRHLNPCRGPALETANTPLRFGAEGYRYHI